MVADDSSYFTVTGEDLIGSLLHSNSNKVLIPLAISPQGCWGSIMSHAFLFGLQAVKVKHPLSFHGQTSKAVRMYHHASTTHTLFGIIPIPHATTATNPSHT
jgi:hypothetical protein